MWNSTITSLSGNGRWSLGLELSLASSQPDLAGGPLSFLSQDTGPSQAILGFGGIYLVFIGFSKEHGFLSPRKTPYACGWELFHKDAGLWQSWVSQLAPGFGLEGHKVASGEWQSFPSGTKGLLVLGDKIPSLWKKDWGPACCSQRVGKIIPWKGPSWANISLDLLPKQSRLGYLPRDASLLQQSSLVSQKWLNSLILLQGVSLGKKKKIQWDINNSRSETMGMQFS